MCHVVLQFPVYELLKQLDRRLFNFVHSEKLLIHVPPQIIPLVTLVVQ